MMQQLIVGILALLMTGCSTTGTSGINFGMSRSQVNHVIERKGYKVIEDLGDRIVVDGIQEQTNQPAEKTFLFDQQGRLISVNDRIK